MELYTFVEVLEDAENDFAEFKVECPGTWSKGRANTK